MTEGQIRFQTIMENQRHNLEMERLGYVEANIKQRQADISQQQADTALFQAQTARKKERLDERRFIWDEIYEGASLWNQSVKNAIDFVSKFVGALFK